MKKSKSMKIHIFSILYNIIFYILIIGIMAGAVMFATDQNPRKSVFGYRFYEALSDSMSPEIRKGDMVILKMTDPSDIRDGDIITYTVDDIGAVTVTHRVLRTTTDSSGNPVFITKGDANQLEDGEIDGSRVIGKVVHCIPAIGFLISLIRQHTGLLLGVVIVFTAAGYGIKRLHKRRGRTGGASDDAHTSAAKLR